MNSDSYLSAGAAIIGAFLSWFLGDLDGLLKILLVLVIIDQITGILKSGISGKWSSNVGFHGIARKVTIFLFVGIAHVIDNELPGQSELLRDTVCSFYIANEGISIIENAIDMNAPVPDILKQRFLSWHNKHLISKNSPLPEDYD